jgi:hypothetical protein
MEIRNAKKPNKPKDSLKEDAKKNEKTFIVEASFSSERDMIF